MDIKVWDHAVHIAFTTYPPRIDPNDYITNISKLYSEQKDQFKELTGIEYDEKYLYKPLAYHLFGAFDVALISLIDTYKFAQKVFEPPYKDNTITNEPINYQIQVGTANEKFNSESLITKFTNLLKDNRLEVMKYPYIMISNLKLNNGLLIGNGADFIEVIQERLQKLVNGKKYIILNTYNWCEITLIVFSDQFNILGEIIQDVREYTLNDCENKDELAEKSLYNKVGIEKEKILNSHCFVDTHSHFGVFKEFFDENNKFETELYTDIEWHIKPGHYKNFIEYIKKIDNFNTPYFFKSGKIDYVTIEKEPKSLNSNHKIYTLLRDNYSEIFDHVRKLKTTVKFEAKQNGDLSTSNGVNNFSNYLKKYLIKNIDEIDSNIKSLGLSRQIRMKLIKVFHNYNTNILDPIMYSYIIDFKAFLEELRTQIDLDADNLKSFIKSEDCELIPVAEIEKKYIYFIEAFEDAFIDRVLNNYNFENLHDFNVDFNASSTQVISIYDTLIKMLGRGLPHNLKKGYLLTRINEVNTESNRISVNYNIHHLIDPSLMMATIYKEIINKVYFYTVEEKLFLNGSYENQFDLIQFWNSKSSSWGSKYKFLFLENFDPHYFFADAYVYLVNFNGDTSLFWYWHWVYHLQNSTQYNTLGNFNKHKFSECLIRGLVIIHLFDKEYLEKLSCPVPELINEWDYFFIRISRYAGEVVSDGNFNISVQDFLDRVTSEYNVLKCFESEVQNILLSPSDKFRFIKKIAFQNRLLLRNFEMEELVRNWNIYESQIPLDSEMNLNKIFDVVMLDCLYYFRKFNSGCSSDPYKIHLLRRHYEKGNPIPEFIQVQASMIGNGIKGYKNTFIDPNGDFFVPDKDLFKEKMKKNQVMFYKLWDIALKYKIYLFD
ncbi:MAG: hypothetical protein IPF46_08435 [Saprospiraceae bacterium]|nr:hypothetical protein [Candidatus Vicinibacter affinis]MBK6571595.1 hypothetical protein [Candidatus Vicinibacter affinis]MBK6822189.1 hypothetical protein [Candidatus Vicinibacter affinis]MBK7797970.1 hypothetical protein [Candidatus Vicinibacter affinis]